MMCLKYPMVIVCAQRRAWFVPRAARARDTGALHGTVSIHRELHSAGETWQGDAESGKIQSFKTQESGVESSLYCFPAWKVTQALSYRNDHTCLMGCSGAWLLTKYHVQK